MNFDPVARSYSWLERLAFGNALQRCRVEFIEHTRNAEDVLILGEGNGRFLEAFLGFNQTARVTVVDSSAEMIRLAAKRCGQPGRVKFTCADVRSLDFEGQIFDLIVTQFFLDCFVEADIRAIISRVGQRLNTGGRWLWSDFAVPTAGWMRLPAQSIIWFLYRFFRVTTSLEAVEMADSRGILRELGLREVDERTLVGGLLESSVWMRDT